MRWGGTKMKSGRIRTVSKTKTPKKRVSGVKKTSANKTQKRQFSPDEINRMIRERAYFIWEERGKPANQDMDCWLTAEREILSLTK